MTFPGLSGDGDDNEEAGGDDDCSTTPSVPRSCFTYTASSLYKSVPKTFECHPQEGTHFIKSCIIPIYVRKRCTKLHALCNPLWHFPLHSVSFHVLNFFECVFTFESERETEHEWGRSRERGRHRIRSGLQALSCQHRARCGFELTNREIVT